MPSDTDYKVIKIEDARELREMGLSIFPIVDKDFSKAAEKLIVEAEKAKAKFYFAFRDYCKATRPTKQRFDRMRKALDKIVSICNRATQFTSADECEAKALQALLTKPMISFVAYWNDALLTVEEGKSVTINVTREMLDGWLVPGGS